MLSTHDNISASRPPVVYQLKVSNSVMDFSNAFQVLTNRSNVHLVDLLSSIAFSNAANEVEQIMQLP